MEHPRYAPGTGRSTVSMPSGNGSAPLLLAYAALTALAVLAASLGVVYASALLAPGPGGLLALVAAWLGVVVAVPPVARRVVTVGRSR